MSRRLAAILFLLLAGVTAPALADGPILVASGQKVAFMGDSITAQGWEVPGGYVKLVTAGLETLGVKIVPIPAGVSGNTSINMLKRLDQDVLSKKPDWLTLSCGVNDVWHGSGGVELEPYKKNITSIVDQAQAAGIKVIIMTATVIQEDTGNDFNKKLVPYNDFLRGFAKERHLPLADENAAFQAALKATPPPPGAKLLTKDGVHPNSDGHQLMARTLLRAFGATNAQLDQVQQAWLDLPDSAFVDAIVTFRLGVPLTIRQYNALKAAAEAQKLSVTALDDKLSFEALDDAVKAHESDPIPPVQGQIEGEAQKDFQAKIEALAK